MRRSEARFVQSLDTGTECTNKALLLKVLHPAQQVTCLQDIRRYTMQLHKIDAFNAKIRRRALDIFSYFVFTVAIRVESRITADLGGHDGRCLTTREIASDTTFALASAIDIRRIPEADTRCLSCSKDLACDKRIYRTKVSAQLPATQANFGDLDATLA